MIVLRLFCRSYPWKIVEPFTHALASLGIARAGQRRLPRFGTAMLIVSGVVSDVDYASYFGGASAFLRLHRAALHSVAGGAVAACVLAGVFCALDKKIPAKIDARKRFAPLAFRTAAVVCAVGILGHVLLDLVSGVGVQLLWPFYTRWFGWPLAAELDLWILVLLCVGMLLPLLFKLVNEEVGDRNERERADAARRSRWCCWRDILRREQLFDRRRSTRCCRASIAGRFRSRPGLFLRRRIRSSGGAWR